ncbi:MAG TPA: hypothetical protein VGI60_12340 [Chthoniobacterales bacterium]|jgi:hypothetical protein
MKRICLTLVWLSLLNNALAGFDFTPTPAERTLEGVVFKQVIFHQDDHAVAYEPPRGWTCIGDKSKMTLVPPNLSLVQCTIDQVPLPAPQSFDAVTTKQLQQQVIASMPSGSENIQLVSEEQNPVRINQQESYAVTMSYRFYGQDYETSVLFANLGNTQLHFRTVALKKDFEAVRRAFRASLFTLSWQTA